MSQANSILNQKTQSHFIEELPSDPVTENYSRQVGGACFSWVNTAKPPQPELLHFSKEFLKELGVIQGDKNEFLRVFSGDMPYPGSSPYAMCYGGHQFGSWAGQLGDGRAIIIADIEVNGEMQTLQLKGAGPTPYSRGGDGFAVLRSSIREYLCSEAMHHLGVPTTRALSLAKTGLKVNRDILYNGNVQKEEGAVVCRVAPSFIRFGSFQIFAAQKNVDTLQKLVDHTIKHHFPHLGAPGQQTYLDFLTEVVESTLELVLHWQRVGFVHGVLNTDNMSIHGLTIDYGPYGWLEDYNPDWTPNTTDAANGRYRFGAQPNVVFWNLVQLANALYPLIEDVPSLEAVLLKFKEDYRKRYHQMMCAKLGIEQYDVVAEKFISHLEQLLKTGEIDYTLFFRELCQEEISFDDLKNILNQTTYLEEGALSNHLGDWNNWFTKYQDILSREDQFATERVANMKKVNPKYVLRNYMAQLAIESAEKGNYQLVDELYNLLLNPYDEQPEMHKWYAKRPEWANDKIGCSMLSCSS